MKTQTPFASCYWVIPNQLVVGEMPIASNDIETKAKLDSLVNLNVSAVINLMEIDEKDHSGNLFFNYQPYLNKRGVLMHQFPIKDMDISSPVQMMRILKQIDFYVKQQKIVYVHCWGGLGRTGTVVGCYMLSKGLTDVQNVLDAISKLKSQSGLADKESPQTNAQREFILDWC
jgi:protein-tyrosine phosphatase